MFTEDAKDIVVLQEQSQKGTYDFSMSNNNRLDTTGTKAGKKISHNK